MVDAHAVRRLKGQPDRYRRSVERAQVAEWRRTAGAHPSSEDIEALMAAAQRIAARTSPSIAAFAELGRQAQAGIDAAAKVLTDALGPGFVRRSLVSSIKSGDAGRD